MTSSNEEQRQHTTPERRPGESPGGQKARVLKQAAGRGLGRTLRPDDIGVVRIEFTVPASRLFRPGDLGFVSGGRSKDVLNDADPTDDIYVFDWDPSDAVIQVPWPPGSDPD